MCVYVPLTTYFISYMRIHKNYSSQTITRETGLKFSMTEQRLCYRSSCCSIIASSFDVFINFHQTLCHFMLFFFLHTARNWKFTNTQEELWRRWSKLKRYTPVWSIWWMKAEECPTGSLLFLSNQHRRKTLPSSSVSCEWWTWSAKH